MKKLNKHKFLFLLTFAFLFVLSGCSNGENNDSAPADIAFVSDTGGIHDKSFNQGTLEAINKYAKAKNVGVTYKESQTETDYIPNLKTMSEKDGIKVVIAAGANLANGVFEVAKEHPDVNYILIDAEPQDSNGKVQKLDNVKSYLFNEQEAGYLVGYIAGKLTTTNKLGFIGGMEIPPVQRFGFGYLQGIAAANPKAQVSYQYSGTFSDSNKGNEMATAMYNTGIDIIFSAAGAVNDGVVNSAKTLAQQGKKDYVIGVDRDIYSQGIYATNKSVVLTSAVKNLYAAVKNGLDGYYNGNFNGGTTTVLGYAENGVGIPNSNPNLDSNKTVVTEAKDSLKNATIADNEKDTKKAIGNLKVNA